MQAWCSAATSSNTETGASAGLLRALALVLLGLLALAWGQEAKAQFLACDLTPLTPTHQLAPANSVVSYTFQIGDGVTPCGNLPPVNGTITIDPLLDTTGGAVPSIANFSGSTGDTVTFTVTLGGTPGGSGQIEVVCVPAADCVPFPPLTFATNNQHVFDPDGPLAVTANQITAFTIGTDYQINGGPSGLPINYTNLTDAINYGNVVPVAGVTSLTQLVTTVGPDIIRATVVCPIAVPLEGCPPPAVDFTVNVEAVEVTPVTPLAPNTTPGTPLNLVARYGSASIAAPDGTALAWTVTAQPPGGDGNVVGNPIAGGNGQSAATFTATVPGTYTVQVDSGCAVCVTPQMNFAVTVATVPGLSIAGGNGQSATLGSAFATPLTVFADDSGTPAVGVAIDWAVTGDATLTPGAANTDGAGEASATVVAGTTPGAVTVVATRLDSGDNVSFNLTVTGLGSLSIISGDGQALVPGVASAPLEVELKDIAGVPVAGATITWTVSGGSLANASSTTNAAGIASNVVTADGTGAVEVTASSVLATAPVSFGLKAGLAASLTALDPRQREIAEAIDNACPALAALPAPSAEQQDFLARCQELIQASVIDPAATVAALDQLMADVALTQANAAFSALQSQFQNLKTRIAALRAGTHGNSFGGLALTTPSGTLSLDLLARALSGEQAPAEVGTDFSRWGFFTAGTIGRGEADPGRVEPGYDYDIEGLTMGLDYRYSDAWIIGGSVGYTRQDTKLPGQAGGLDTTGWSISAYTTYYRADSWYLDGVLTWGRNDYELLRRISYTLPTPGGGSSSIDQVAVADSGGDLLSIAGTFGRDFNRGPWGFGPYGRVLYTRVGFDTISEKTLPGLPGSGLGLRIDSRDLSSLASVIGGKLTYTHSAPWGVLMPHLQLEWEHEFKDDPQAIEARFLHDPTGSAMLVRGDALDTDYLRLGLGMSMVLTKGRSGFFYYERLLGKDGMSQYNLALGYRMEF